MSDITYTNKSAGSSFTHEDANEIKIAVNSKVDKDGEKVLSENNYTDVDKATVDNTSGTNTGDQDLSGLQPKEIGKGLSTNDFDNTYKGNVDKVTIQAASTLVTGTNALDLTTLVGKEYSSYDMASGALTLTAAASPIMGGCAYGIIIADGATVPNVTAFTVFSGEYDNTNDVENHFIVVRKLNGSVVATNYLQWIQPV